MIETTMRNQPMVALEALLQQQQDRKLDAVAPGAALDFEDGELVLEGMEGAGRYRPTPIFIEGLADKLKIPLPYLRKLHEHRTDLFDANVNGWLQGVDGGDPDDRSFLVRMFKANGSPGVGRAFLSGRYRPIDNLDVLTAALAGIGESGVEVGTVGCDLSERRMSVKIAAPDVRALAPALLRGYKSPFTGAKGEENPTVFAGFALGNSENGNGAFTITPYLTVQVCNNGLTLTKEAVRNVHLGGQLDNGVIEWSDATNQKAIELITAQAKDAVRTFLDVGYMTRVLRELEAKAEHRVDPSTAVTVVAKRLSFDQETTAGVFRHFLESGQHTAGGVMNAVTSWAQTETDPDKALALEAQAIPALDLAATL